MLRTACAFAFAELVESSERETLCHAGGEHARL